MLQIAFSTQQHVLEIARDLTRSMPYGFAPNECTHLFSGFPVTGHYRPNSAINILVHVSWPTGVFLLETYQLQGHML